VPPPHHPTRRASSAHVIHDFVEHYHVERNHQGLGNVIPFPSRASPQFEGTVCRRQRLGGVLKFYERKAA
jgi:putative transposase